MTRKLTLLLIGAIALPLAALLWLGLGLSRDQQRLVEQQLKDLQHNALSQAASAMQSEMDKISARLSNGLEKTKSAPELEEVRGKEGLAAQVFEMNFDQRMVWPDPDRTRSAMEDGFLLRTANLRQSDDFQALFRKQESSDGGSYNSELGSTQTKSSGWISWHWQDGERMLYWQRLNRGIAGIEVDPVVLVSQLVAVLPDGVDSADRIRLEDAAGRIIYQWGRYQPAEGEQPKESLHLETPMHFWKLAYYSDPSADTALGQSRQLIFILVFLGVLLAGGGLAWTLYRETGRDLREASQRVNFVNQVSHELKTPLTNIRLYAELLQRRLDEKDEQAQKQLGVISGESQRLSRLIGNILNFSKKQKSLLSIRRSPQVLDEIVSEVCQRFAPALEEKGIQISLDLKAPASKDLDKDAVEQVLSNLISNVEKYAAQGKWLAISTRQQSSNAWLRVEDRGPGINKKDREKVFEPYFRLDDKLTAQASGTGIGLGLARDLVRLHGGDLAILDSDKGSIFEARFGSGA